MHSTLLFMTEELTRGELGFLASCSFGSVLYCVHDGLCRAFSMVIRKRRFSGIGWKMGNECWLCSVKISRTIGNAIVN